MPVNLQKVRRRQVGRGGSKSIDTKVRCDRKVIQTKNILVGLASSGAVMLLTFPQSSVTQSERREIRRLPERCTEPLTGSRGKCLLFLDL